MSDAEMEIVPEGKDDPKTATDGDDATALKTGRSSNVEGDDADSADGSSDEMEQDEEDSDEDDDDYDAGEEAYQIKQYLELLGKIQEDKYNYDLYVQLLDLAHKMTDLEKIRQSAEIFAAMYPLSPEIWLRWLRIEVALASSPDQLKQVDQLFRRALGDYYSVEVATEYAALAAKGDRELAEQIWDVLIPTYGLHTTKGRNVFEAYREDFLAKNGETSKEINRLARIYEQELKIPLKNMEDSYIEYKLLCEKYKDTLEDLNPEKFERRYKQAKELLQRMIPFENRLVALEPHCHQERAELYREYIKECRSLLGEDEMQVLYERSVADCCLDPSVWCDYLKYLDRYPPDVEELPTSPVFSQTTLDVVNRALRNCPWSAELYVEKLRIVEREKGTREDILKIMEEVATVEFQAPEPAVKVWLEYLTYLRRHANFEDEKERDILRSNFELAWNQLGRTWGDSADPECKILQFWGRLEYGALADPLRGRDLWQSVMDSSDNSKRVGLWIEWAELEAKRGMDAVRKLFRKAINSVDLNDPETLAAAWMRFERCNGSLEQLTSCQEICLSTIQAYYKSLNYQQRALKGRKSDPKKETDADESSKKKNLKRVHDQQCPVEKREDVFKKPSVQVGPAISRPKETTLEETTKRIKLEETTTEESTSDSNRVFFSNLSFEVTEDDIRKNFPELKFKSIELVQGSSGKSRGFGYVEFETSQDVQKALTFDRRPLDGRPVFISPLARDKSNRPNKFKYSESFEPNKLFIKGLPFEAGNEDVRKLFERFGKLKDVRVVFYRSGKSKGLAYVEFENESAAKSAVMAMDQYEMNGFTLSVALSAPPPRGNPTAENSTSNPEPGTSLGGGKRHLVKGDVKQKLSTMIPTALLRKTAATAPKPGSSSVSNKPKSNEDFRKLLLK
ncbi:squamous cell carcinoma antigen recognized by T-cells 3 [Uranotaenia lowii]|uniref:squamous cell carcinoma antigen recognized by T-cells 3 n=1 Tax=Uranotaenia lowii TaxID=190385 RepID=UPI0024795CB9|nr:squamous cell carcinoma antigen recognized by T-cells 3 [Uranotaenia lowii]